MTEELETSLSIWVICPIFSSNVMRERRSLTRSAIGCSGSLYTKVPSVDVVVAFTQARSYGLSTQVTTNSKSSRSCCCSHPNSFLPPIASTFLRKKTSQYIVLTSSKQCSQGHDRTTRRKETTLKDGSKKSENFQFLRYVCKARNRFEGNSH